MEVERYLEYGEALDCAFNRRGTLLATGLRSGYCVIWDFETRGVSLLFKAHDSACVSVGWSRSGRFLVTAAHGRECAVWDLKNIVNDVPERVHLTVTQAELSSIVVHPRGEPIVLLCPFSRPPALLNWTTGIETPIAPDALSVGEVHVSERQRQPTYCGCFERYGKWLFLGDSRGMLHLVDVAANTVRGRVYPLFADARCLQRVGSMPVGGKDGIRSITLDRTGQFLAVNCTRTIRLYTVKLPTPGAADSNGGLGSILTTMHEFSDVVNNWTWARCCFSRDSEYIVATVSLDNVDKIYMWDVDRGHLRKILEGRRKEGIRTISVRMLFADRTVLTCKRSGTRLTRAL